MDAKCGSGYGSGRGGGDYTETWVGGAQRSGQDLSDLVAGVSDGGSKHNVQETV